MINVSEHVKRPEDMLMFLGEYFKVVILRTENVAENIKSDTGLQTQVDFFLTYEILNQLGTACKMFIENPRQELRISIALSRSPSFKDGSD